MRKDWLYDLGDRMEDFEESTPEGLWDDIETSVPFAMTPKKRWYAHPLWWSLPAAAALALGVFTIFNDGEKAEKDTVIAEATKVVEPTYKKLIDKDGESAVGKESGEIHVIERPARAKQGLTAMAESLEEKPSVAREPETAPKAPQPSDAPKLRGNHPSNAAGPERTEEVGESEAEQWNEFMMEVDNDERRKARKAPVTIGIAMGGETASQNNRASFNPVVFNKGASSFSSPLYKDSPIILTRATDATVMNSNVIYDNIRHSRPVKTGLILNFPLYRALGIETGLTYTYLNSSFKATSGDTETEDTQTLRYVGIPLNLTVRVFDSRYFSAYASAGGLAERCVSGKVVSATYENGVKTKDLGSSKLKIDNLQWSANIAAGLQFNVTKNIGLYAEPGLSYHFDDGSGVKTIYKEHPLDFSISFGLRFSFNQRY